MAHPTQRNGAFSSTGLSRFFALRILFASAMAFALFLFASLFLLASDTASSNYDNMVILSLDVVEFFLLFNSIFCYLIQFNLFVLGFIWIRIDSEISACSQIRSSEAAT